MIPQDVEILYEKKQLVLEQQVQSSAIVSNFVAGSIQSQVSKESTLSKTIRWHFFRPQVQPRLLHRSFSAGQSVHNCIFNIKVLFQLNTRQKDQNGKAAAQFRSRRFTAIYTLIFMECDVALILFSKGRILLLSFTELYFSFKMMYFFLKHYMLSTEAKSELKDVEILEAT